MALPNPIYILLKNGEILTGKEVTTITDVDLTYYDGSTYRNELSGGYVGGANVNVLTGTLNYSADFKSKDDRYNAVAPFPEEKTRTERQFANAGGDIVARCWLDEFKGYSDTSETLIS